MNEYKLCIVQSTTASMLEQLRLYTSGKEVKINCIEMDETWTQEEKDENNGGGKHSGDNSPGPRATANLPISPPWANHSFIGKD